MVNPFLHWEHLTYYLGKVFSLFGISVGQLVSASAPNITGNLESWGAGAFNTDYTTGCFVSSPNYNEGIRAGDRSNNIACSAKFSAKVSSSVYQDNVTTITVNSIITNFYIKF